MTKNRNNAVEIVYVSTRKVSCNGSKDNKISAFGHPASYLDMGNNDNVSCPYCGRNFKLKSTK